MKKYTYQTCIRLPENIREPMQEVCENFRINESDYIRRSIAQSLQNDLELQDDKRFQFV